MKTRIIILSIAVVSFMGISSVLGQTPIPAQQGANTTVNDTELKQFVEAYKKIQVLDQDAQQKMIKAVEDCGITVQKYNEINESFQNPESETEATPEEMESFKLASEKVTEIQQKTQPAVQNEIEKQGLTMQRYQEIYVAIQQDPNLMEKFKEIMN
jgi:hypothetical protein